MIKKYDIADLEVDQKKLLSMAQAFAKAIASTRKQKQLKGA